MLDEMPIQANRKREIFQFLRQMCAQPGKPQAGVGQGNSLIAQTKRLSLVAFVKVGLGQVYANGQVIRLVLKSLFKIGYGSPELTAVKFNRSAKRRENRIPRIPGKGVDNLYRRRVQLTRASKGCNPANRFFRIRHHFTS